MNMLRKSRSNRAAGLDSVDDCHSTASLSSTASAFADTAASRDRDALLDHAMDFDPFAEHAGHAESQQEGSGGGEWDGYPCTCPMKYRRAIYGSIMTALYIVAWVANGEVLQGLTDGSMASFLLSSNASSQQEQQQQQQQDYDTASDNMDIDVPSFSYNRPTFITWFSYNYMMLSWFVVLWWHRPTSPNSHRSCSIASRCRILANYMRYQWPGRLGLRRAMLFCTGIGYCVQLLNIAFILGLNCISVSLSNAIFQLQTGIVVLISVAYLGDTFTKQQAWGMLFSAVGVGLIVLPPMLHSDSDDAEDDDQSVCPNVQVLGVHFRPMLIGVLATVAAAAVGAGYYVSWRVFSEQREIDKVQSYVQARSGGAGDDSSSGGIMDHDGDSGISAETVYLSSLQPMSADAQREVGFLDTHATLAMIGTCNLLFGWPSVLFMHGTGLDPLQLPQYWIQWMCLLANGLVEYAFDASCALTIYLTSPLVASIVAPLTLPVSVIADRVLHTTSMSGTDAPETSSAIGLQFGWPTFFGALFILLGIALLEMSTDDVMAALRWCQRQVGRVPLSARTDANPPSIQLTKSGGIV